MKPVRMVALGVAFGAVWLLVLFAGGADKGRVGAEIVGKPVPPVRGRTLDGDRYDIETQRGKWVVVNFFATWCVPCRIEHPEFMEFARRHGRAGDATIVQVVIDDDPEEVARFFRREGRLWPVIVGDTGKIAIEFGMTAVPETYLTSPDGIVVAKWISSITADQLDEAIRRGGSSS
ncbi:MAG: thiol:disulfide interchange protein [Acidimicrobiales bacterium]|nr:MAG: thiol:disulfide interchange protein [Acidimicrobiales bacterium]